MTITGNLPTFDQGVDSTAAAERGDGWLAECEAADRFLVPTCELIEALARFLRPLGGPVLEVAAGRGELAEALRDAGVEVLATDADSSPGSPVERRSASDALRHYRPRVVLGSFVPIDAGVDEAVLACPTVEHYVVLGARIGGLFGSPALWRNGGWTAAPAEDVARWMLTRHDVWLGRPGQPLLQHGEAWHLVRRQG